MAMDHQHNTAMSQHEKAFHAVSPHQPAIHVHYHDKRPISHNRTNRPPWPIGPNRTNWVWTMGIFSVFILLFYLFTNSSSTVRPWVPWLQWWWTVTNTTTRSNGACLSPGNVFLLFFCLFSCWLMTYYIDYIYRDYDNEQPPHHTHNHPSWDSHHRDSHHITPCTLINCDMSTHFHCQHMDTSKSVYQLPPLCAAEYTNGRKPDNETGHHITTPGPSYSQTWWGHAHMNKTKSGRGWRWLGAWDTSHLEPRYVFLCFLFFFLMKYFFF